MFLRIARNALYIFAALFGISITTAHAIGVPKIERLTPENFAELGFEISVKKEYGALSVEFTGPEKINRDCPATRSGAYLLDETGDELMVFVSEIVGHSGRPNAIGYQMDNANRMGVFFEYICPEHHLLDSKRYEIESLADFLPEE